MILEGIEMHKVNIVNCLLTRKCNLHCSYCRISGDIHYITKPTEYPKKDWYFDNEKDSAWWIDAVNRLHKHNPEVFFILYGGEPFLRWELLADLVNHMNANDMNYTIISSCNEGIQKFIYKFFEKVEYVKGFTSSIDPGFWKVKLKSRQEMMDDEMYKSHTGFRTLLDLMEKGLVKDPVAEITCDYVSIFDLEETVRRLTELGITSDVTTIDLAHNNFYDFSNIDSVKALVHPTEEVLAVFKRLKESDYMIHMKDYLMDAIPEKLLPSNLKCNIGTEHLSNLTIEPTGELRLCLRIRGRFVPRWYLTDLIQEDGQLSQEDMLPIGSDSDGIPKTKAEVIAMAFEADYDLLCKEHGGCCWTCMLMSMNDDCSGVINH